MWLYFGTPKHGVLYGWMPLVWDGDVHFDGPLSERSHPYLLPQNSFMYCSTLSISCQKSALRHTFFVHFVSSDTAATIRSWFADEALPGVYDVQGITALERP